MSLFDFGLRYTIRRYFRLRAYAKMREESSKANKILPKKLPSIKTSKVNKDLELEKEMFDQLDRGVGRKR